jgi:hypothetical protein
VVEIDNSGTDWRRFRGWSGVSIDDDCIAEDEWVYIGLDDHRFVRSRRFRREAEPNDWWVDGRETGGEMIGVLLLLDKESTESGGWKLDDGVRRMVDQIVEDFAVNREDKWRENRWIKGEEEL